jgi:hypothetical protein
MWRPHHPGESRLCHRHIHDIVVAYSTDQDAYLPSLIFSHLLDIAHRQEPGDIGLPSTTSPCFGEDRRRYDRRYFFGQQSGMQCPHPPVIAFGGDQRPRVVGDTGHLRRLRPC